MRCCSDVVCKCSIQLQVVIHSLRSTARWQQLTLGNVLKKSRATGGQKRVTASKWTANVKCNRKLTKIIINFHMYNIHRRQLLKCDRENKITFRWISFAIRFVEVEFRLDINWSSLQMTKIMQDKWLSSLRSSNFFVNARH